MISFYMDSIFAEGGTPDVRPLHTIPRTIAQLYLLAMHEHEREAAIRHRDSRSDEWKAMPDWRLDRWTIRLGLYLEERTGLEPGDRVAVLSELRPEWIVSDLAVLASGAVCVGIDPALPDAAIRDVLGDVQPRVLLASSRQLARFATDGRPASSAEHVISFGPPAGENVVSLAAAIDLGGTLDTPERASAFRERAREIAPDTPALQHHHAGDGDASEMHELNQSAVIDLLSPHWNGWPAAPGDIALVAGPGVDFATRLALHTFVGDGRTCVALGDGERLPEEAAAVRPHKIVAPPVALERIADHLPQPVHDRGSGGISAMLRALTGVADDGRRSTGNAALGGRVRWVAATRPLDPTLAARLADAGAIVPLTLIPEVS